MKAWTPIATSTAVVIAGVAALLALAETSARGTFVDGIDPGEVACTDLISGDLLELLHDDYRTWGTDVHLLAQVAADSEEYGVALAADAIVDYIDVNGEFTPIELYSMTVDLAESCVTAEFISDAQVSAAIHR